MMEPSSPSDLVLVLGWGKVGPGPLYPCLVSVVPEFFFFFFFFVGPLLPTLDQELLGNGC